jgi:hypothetical protein
VKETFGDGPATRYNRPGKSLGGGGIRYVPHTRGRAMSGYLGYHPGLGRQRTRETRTPGSSLVATADAPPTGPPWASGRVGRSGNVCTVARDVMALPGRDQSWSLGQPPDRQQTHLIASVCPTLLSTTHTLSTSASLCPAVSRDDCRTDTLQSILDNIDYNLE